MPARPADRAARPPAMPPHGARQGRARQKHRGLAFFGPSKHTRVGEPVNAATLAARAALDDDPETSLAIMVAAVAASGRYPAYLR